MEVFAELKSTLPKKKLLISIKRILVEAFIEEYHVS